MIRFTSFGSVVAALLLIFSAPPIHGQVILPPEEGGEIISIGQPPLWKPYGGGSLGSYQPGNAGDTSTLSETLEATVENLGEVQNDPATAEAVEDTVVQEVVADKGYHSGQTLAGLEKIDLRPYVSEPQRGRRKWTPTDPQEGEFKRAEQAAVYRNRRRSGGAVTTDLNNQLVLVNNGDVPLLRVGEAARIGNN